MKPMKVKAVGMPTPLLVKSRRKHRVRDQEIVGFDVHKVTMSPSSLVSLSQFIHRMFWNRKTASFRFWFLALP
jgi:hypothetical protein